MEERCRYIGFNILGEDNPVYNHLTVTSSKGEEVFQTI